MKILVTGATGFIGKHVLEHLVNSYPEIHIVATSTSATKFGELGWNETIEFKEFDLNGFTDSEINYFDLFGRPDKIIHLAWQGLPNYKELYHFEHNLPLHYAFLKHLITRGCRDITVIGTCFEYGMQEGSLKESTPALPANPYALAKDSLRRFLEELNLKENFNFKWVRLFYMYGPGQAKNSLIPQLQAALERKDKQFNMSGGEQVRDFLPVERVAENIVKISLQTKITGIINCCSGLPIAVKDFVINYLKVQQKTIELNLGYYPYPDYEPMRFWGENSKLISVTTSNK